MAELLPSAPFLSPVPSLLSSLLLIPLFQRIIYIVPDPKTEQLLRLQVEHVTPIMSTGPERAWAPLAGGHPGLARSAARSPGIGEHAVVDQSWSSLLVQAR